MSREKGSLAQAGPASTRAGTPTVSPADTVRTLTLNCPLTDVSPVPIKKLNTPPQAQRSLIPTLRAKVDVMPSGSFAAWYARFFFIAT